MKKLWTKFKRWLIVKLGGYLEGPRKFTVDHVRPFGITVQARGVCVVYTIPGDELQHTTREHALNCLFEKLGDELRKHPDLYSTETAWDPITDEVVHKLVIYVLPKQK